MNTLSKKELMDINLRMLGKGAPIELDGVGYNKVDYAKMAWLSNNTDLTDNEAYVLATVLLKYTHTQLLHKADEIKATVQHYQKLIKEVKVVGFNRDEVRLSWNFNTKISNYIKHDMDRTHFRWLRPNGEWVLQIEWEHIKPLLDTFVSNGYSTTQIQIIHDNLDELLKDEPESQQQSQVKSLILKVERPSTLIDTLMIEVPYHDAVVKAFKKVPFMSFNKSSKTWECYIEYSLVLYKELESLKIKGFDISQLKPWADLVSGWSKTYQMIDLDKCPLKFQPYDFQIEDIQKLLQSKVMLNGNDMGCGKTFEQVVVGESLPMKKLVICPPTLRINWKKEILHVNPKAKVHIIYSADDFEVVDGWNIIGYNSLDTFLKQLEAEQFQAIMIDEAHYIQAISNAGTPESKRAYAVLRLAATANYVYPITGTPKTNRNKNLFNILRVIRHPLTRGKWSFSNYGRTYCDGQNNGWGWDYNGNSHDAELNKQLTPFMVRHLKKDVLPNLKKQRIVTPVEVDLREYHYEISEYLKNRTNKNAEDLARLMRARKILATQKVGESIDFARNLISDGKKVVIVTYFTEVIKAIEKAFKGNVVKLVGGMSDEAKDKAIVEFQEGSAQVMAMNIVAGGVGVTLTKSYNMVVNDFDWTPGNLTQAEDRICRSGQTEEFCNIYYLYASGADMDEVFAETLTSKFSTINSAVDGGEGDEIDYLDLINSALEKSIGIKKVRKMVKVKEDNDTKTTKQEKPKKQSSSTASTYKDKTLEELIEIANKVGAICKKYDNPSIYRMRLVMAIKKQIGE